MSRARDENRAREGERKREGRTLTDLVVELWKLHLHFVPLEVVVLCLLAHRWDEVELAGHRIRLLVGSRKRYVLVTPQKTVNISPFHTHKHTRSHCW